MPKGKQWYERGLRTFTFDSNVKMMEAMGKHDPRNSIPENMYVERDAATRLFRAKLLLEETMETIEALGVRFQCTKEAPTNDINDYEFYVTEACDLESIIDGCCDTIYVACGCLLAHGVFDYPHLREVCRANDRKYPEGKAIVDENGKGCKPADWVGPDHHSVIMEFRNTGLDQFMQHLGPKDGKDEDVPKL